MAARRRLSLLIVILLIPPSIVSGQGGAPADQQVSPGCGLNRTVPPLPANAEQMARDLRILPLVERVRALAPTCAPAGGVSIEELSLRQQIMETLLTASLDVDEVIAEISYEQDQIAEVQNRLSNAKTNKVNTLTLAATLVGSGTSAIGTGMGLKWARRICWRLCSDARRTTAVSILKTSGENCQSAFRRPNRTPVWGCDDLRSEARCRYRTAWTPMAPCFVHPPAGQ
jgi:hypothetical protein